MDKKCKSRGLGSQKIRIGALVEVALGEGSYAYGRIVSKSELAFYDLLVEGAPSCYDAIYTQPIAFAIPVMNTAVRSNRWKIIDEKPLERELAQERLYFMKDKLTRQYSLYYSSTGEIQPSCKEICVNLEPAAVWDAQHVEDRLRKHFRSTHES